MLHKLKIISYSLIILFVLILPSQAVAQCLTKDECAAAAEAQGLTYVDAKPNRATMGCYTYSSGNYAGSVYFGMGGTDEENNAVLDPPKYRFCGPNKTDPTSPQYIAEEKEAVCRSEARAGACKEYGAGRSGHALYTCKTVGHYSLMSCFNVYPCSPEDKGVTDISVAAGMYRPLYKACIARK